MPEAASASDRLTEITLDDTGLAPPTPEIEQERRVAIFDLIEENRFAAPPREDRPVPEGPYPAAPRDPRPATGVRSWRPSGDAIGAFHLSLTPFNQVVKDDSRICESYFDAVKRLPASQIEAIDRAAAPSTTWARASCSSALRARSRPTWRPRAASSP